MYRIRIAGSAVLFLLLFGCASAAKERLAASIADGIANQDDLTIVRTGTPSYLIMVDGFISNDPDDIKLLIAASRLYSAYAAVAVNSVGRRSRMVGKAYDYARHAACLHHEQLCTEKIRFERFENLVSGMGKGDLALLYAYATAWAGFIAQNTSDWKIVADLPKVRVLFERILALEEDYEYGQAHLYLGVIQSQLPAALGGRPEEARRHFRRAIDLSGGRNLIAKVEYARHYARLVFDRELHDRLLREVIAATAAEPGLTLSNIYAQEEARTLLADSNEYFGD